MARKSTRELMEEKAKKLNSVSPSQALFGMGSGEKVGEGTDAKEMETTVSQVSSTITDEEKAAKPTEVEKENTESVSNEVVQRSERKHQILSFKKQKVEDTHTRQTFLVRNELLARFDKLAKGKHGFKTEFINYAIESALNEIEEELKK